MRRQLQCGCVVWCSARTAVFVFLSAISIAHATPPTSQAVVRPSQDAFARQAAPTTNYGAAGALAIAGEDAVNGLGTPQGPYDTVIQFDMSGPIQTFNTVLGVDGWALSAARLTVTEVGAPTNSIFNRGVGDFQVFWLSDDNWVEGTGSPLFPVIGTGNQITWNLLQTILASASLSSMGQFSNSLTNGPLTFDLAMPAEFVADFNAGGPVSLYLTRVTTTLGFTFNSRNYFIETQLPELLLTATSVRGDMNCDGAVTVDDVPPFVLALLDPDAYLAMFPDCPLSRADLSNDGLRNGTDIAPFVSCLLGGPQAPALPAHSGAG